MCTDGPMSLGPLSRYRIGKLRAAWDSWSDRARELQHRQQLLTWCRTVWDLRMLWHYCVRWHTVCFKNTQAKALKKAKEYATRRHATPALARWRAWCGQRLQLQIRSPTTPAAGLEDPVSSPVQSLAAAAAGWRAVSLSDQVQTDEYLSSV